MKTIYAIYCVLITLAMLSTPALAEYDIAGDVNNDGMITTADSLLALRMAVGSVAPDPERADVNADGRVNSLDALMIRTMAEKTQVCVNAPEVVSGEFEVTIDIHNVNDLDSGQFDLSFDPGVVRVTAVHDGDISGRPVPIDMWRLMDAGRIRILFNHLPGLDGVSGSGYVAKIDFETTGSEGDTSVLDISGGVLTNVSAPHVHEIPAIWINDEVRIGELAPTANQVRNVNTGEDFSFIQAAIDDPDTLDGHVIEVGDGVYHENVNVTKSLTIRSLNGSANCVIEAARRCEHAALVTVDCVNISGFKVLGATPPKAGIYLNAGYCNVSNNNCSNNRVGIHLNGSDNNIISGNDCSNNNYESIHLNGSSNNIVSGNDCSNNNYDGIHLYESCNNIVSGNNCSNNRDDGVHFYKSCNNVIYLNNFINNKDNINSRSSANTWNSTSRINYTYKDRTFTNYLGNYRDDYEGSDSDNDGIGDSPYRISSDWDNCPLIAPFENYSVPTENMMHVSVNAPEVISGSFNATIDIHHVADLDSGQFDLSFDSRIVNVTDVDAGNIGGTTVPIIDWRFMDVDTIRVTFKLSGASGVSGSGYMAGIGFAMLGPRGCVSVLDISNGKLVDTRGKEMPAVWFDDEVTTSVPVAVNAPPVVSGAFEVTIDIENVTDLDSGQFDLSFDPGVLYVEDVGAGSIGDAEIPIIRWCFRDADTIRVFFNLHGLNGTSGSGYAARIYLGIKGSQGDTSVLDISNGKLVDASGAEIPAIWTDDEVIIGEYTPVNRVHNINTGEDFSFIQAAIDDPDTSDGHVIEVGDGVYYENVRVTKSLTIRSLNGSANCVIQGAGGNRVVEITVDQVSIRGFTVKILPESRFGVTGIYLDASDCNVSNNNCLNNRYGICLNDSSNSSISSNTCSNNERYGIRLDGSSNNVVSGNNCSNNNWDDGISLSRSSNNKLTDNVMFEGGISIWGDSLSDYTHEIDESNTVNGKPVYYWLDIECGRIPDGAGQVILVNCKDILVENQELNNGSVGVDVAFSSNIPIRNNNCSNNRYGIRLYESCNSSISSNNCSNNGAGIRIDDSGNSSISSNNCSNNGAGIRLDDSCNSRISNNKCLNNRDDGIHLDDSGNSSISSNNCSNNGAGIRLDDSCNSRISNNKCLNNRDDGIYLDDSGNSSISSNNCSNNGAGIRLDDSGNSRLTGNTMFENGICIRGNSLSDYTHEIDESNTVNGKPVYYWLDTKSGRIPDGAGQVILVNCKYILVEDQELNNGSVGVDVVFSSNIAMRNNDCSNNRYGIRLDGSSNNTVSGNNCSNNRDNGIYLDESCNNIIYLNNFINNADNINSRRSINIRNSTLGINYTYEGRTFTNYLGNYWDDYEENDSDNDGIGDFPYRIDSDRDNFPLMMPFENYSVQTGDMAWVNVNAPEIISGTFDATLDIYHVAYLDSGQFDLTFDSSVVNVTGVTDGNIDGTTVPIACWRFMDADTIRVIFKLSDEGGVSGSGYVAGIDFETTGLQGDASVLDISNGKFVDTRGYEIPVIRNDCEVTIRVPVTVHAPPVVSGAFEVTIDIEDVTDLDSGQFDLSFNSSIVNVTAVHDGDIDGRSVPVESWDFVDAGTIRVLFNLPGLAGVSGQGQIATISFEVTGSQGDSCVMDISDGLLVDTDASVIPAIWNDCEVAIIEAETPHVMVNAPEIVSGTFDVAIDIKNVIGLASGQFDLSFNSGVVNVTGVDTGKIDNTTIPITLWQFIDSDTIRIFFELSDGNGVSGSGYVARVDFEITGSQGDVSVLDISNGVLVDTGGENMPAIWTPDHVTIVVPVTVNAPEVVSGAFEVTIDIGNVTDLDCGQFELSFDSSIVNVTGVSAGNISGTAVPMDMWVFSSDESIRVLFNLPGLAGVSGSGQIATISFETTGSDGYSVLGISDELLVDNRANAIPSIWTDDMVISGEYTLVDRVHNLNTGEDFFFIEDAIDDSDTSDGHTIIVGDGVHRENIKVTKSLTIRSENGSANCVIKARGNDHAVEITADYVNMSGFTVTGAAFLKAGICLDAGYCNISINNCSNNWIGIHLDGSSNNIVSDNDCSNTGWDGIRLEDSSNNIISGNDCSNNKMTGIHFRESSNNIISSNNCSNNKMTGIRFRESSNNIVSITDCSNNGYEGINLEDSNNNNISGNNCSNNGIETGGFGITLRGSSNNRISGNKVSFNRWNGIILRDSMTCSSNNNIVRNNISNNGQFWEPPLASGCAAGISLTGSGNSVIENTFVNDGIHIYHDSTKNEVRGNIVNGKPLIYLESESDQEIEGAGQVILANCDNITVEHSNTSNTIVGIHLMETNNCKITKNNISSNYMHGIRLDGSSNNTIGDNDINSNNQHGIYVFGSSDNNTIRENLIELNKVDGIHLFFSGHNELINNTVNRNHEYGIYLWSLGSTNTLRGNRMSGNKYNFAVPHSSDDDVDTTNLVDGKPIYYIKNASDLTIDGTTNAGTVYCVNCENVTVKDLVLANNGAGVCFYDTNNSRIENVTSIDCREGIGLHKSHRNTLTNNCASNGQDGVYMEWSDDNVLTNNDVLNNSRGVYLYRSNNSLMYFNNFIYNSLNVQSRNSTNIWSSPSIIHYTYDGSAHSNYPGNYWDDYNGTDTNNDGIGESPYYIDSDRDDCPLVMPIENYFVETESIQEQKEI